MSFQDEYKITSADRLDKGVYGLPDTPGMTTAAIQERFDSLGNLAIDKFNALVEAASDVVDGSDTKFPTNKAVQDYISGEGGAIIDDTTPSLHKAYSSQKVESMFSEFPSELIDDSGASATTVYSSSKVEEIVADLPTPESVIDDDTASTATTYSSSKLESDFISVSDTEEQTATDEFTTINGGLLSECKVALSPNQDLHGYDNPWVGGAGKNKLENSYTSRTVSGITFTVYSDGTIMAEEGGTSIGGADFVLGTFNSGGVATILNGCPSGGSSSTYMLNATGGYSDTGNGVNLPSTFNNQVYIRIRDGYTVPSGGLLFKPMIRLASDTDPTFAPYSNICPISGHTQVEVENHQKNLFNPSTCVLNKYIDDDGTIGSANGFMYSQPICVKDGSYKFSGSYSGSGSYSVRILGYDKDDNFVSLLGRQGGSASQRIINVDATVTSGIKFVRLSLPQAINEPQLELGSTATPYEPYNGYQVTVNLGGTYYSGTLDVVSGVFVPDTARLAINTSTIASISKSGLTSADIFTLALPSTYKLSANAILSHYPYINTENVNEVGKAWLGTSNTQLRIGFSAYGTTTLEDFKTWLDANNVEGCFELATPTPIQLSPTMVKALVGENHLSTPLEGQEITESIYSPLAKWNAVIDDTTASNDTTYSSNKINTIIPQINDNVASASSVYSSNKVENLINGIPLTPIDDTEARSDATFSSEKIMSLISGSGINPMRKSVINTTLTIV